MLEPANNKAEILVACVDDFLHLVSNLLEEIMDLSEINIFDAELALRNTVNKFLHASDKFEVVYAPFLMHANLNAFALPFVLLSELLGGNESYRDEKLELIGRVEAVSDNVLVDQSTQTILFEIGQPHHFPFKLLIQLLLRTRLVHVRLPVLL